MVWSDTMSGIKGQKASWSSRHPRSSQNRHKPSPSSDCAFDAVSEKSSPYPRSP